MASNATAGITNQKPKWLQRRRRRQISRAQLFHLYSQRQLYPFTLIQLSGALLTSLSSPSPSPHSAHSIPPLLWLQSEWRIVVHPVTCKAHWVRIDARKLVSALVSRSDYASGEGRGGRGGGFKSFIQSPIVQSKSTMKSLCLSCEFEFTLWK